MASNKEEAMPLNIVLLYRRKKHYGLKLKEEAVFLSIIVFRRKKYNGLKSDESMRKQDT